MGLRDEGILLHQICLHALAPNEIVLETDGQASFAEQVVPGGDQARHGDPQALRSPERGVLEGIDERHGGEDEIDGVLLQDTLDATRLRIQSQRGLLYLLLGLDG